MEANIQIWTILINLVTYLLFYKCTSKTDVAFKVRSKQLQLHRVSKKISLF